MRSICRAIAHYAASASTTKCPVVRSTTFALHSYYSTASSTATKTKSKPFQNSQPLPSSSRPRTTGDGSVDTERPRPREVPFQPKVANSVNLIGHVLIPVEFQTTPDGKSWAATVITRKDPSDSTSLWIPIIFEGDLAHIAAFHLKEKDCVHISGELGADLSHLENQGRGSFQIMVRTLNFVQGYAYQKNGSDILKQKGASTYTVNEKDTVNQSWLDLLSKPEEWWDIRSEENNKKAAAFERKENGELLFVDNSTPKWIIEKLETITFDHRSELKSGKVVVKNKEESWRDLINNPENWRDYRGDKIKNLVKPKHPDFKRKDGSLPLWLNSAPQWVHFELKEKEVDVQTSNTKQGSNSVAMNNDDCWRDLINNPKQWRDYRSDKLNHLVNPKHPDFKRKDRSTQLWLNKAPQWVHSELDGKKSDVQKSYSKQENGSKDGDMSWKDLVENPKKWWDNRLNKRNKSAPDFKHKETGAVLWLTDSPSWVLAKLPPLKSC